MTAGQLPNVAAGFCDAKRHREVGEFFAQLEDAPPGTDRNVRLALEDIERCFRAREVVQAPLGSYLREYASAQSGG